MGGRQAFDLLERVSKADESWRMPRCSPPTECKRAVVVTATHAESNAVVVEADKGKEHHIEPACTH